MCGNAPDLLEGAFLPGELLGEAVPGAPLAEEPLFLFHGTRIGWIATYEGRVRFRLEEREAFHGRLRAYLRSVLCRSIPVFVLVPGHLGPDDPSTLRIDVRSGEAPGPEAGHGIGETPMVLLVGGSCAVGLGKDPGTVVLGMRIATPDTWSPRRILLADDSRTGPRSLVDVPPELARPWIASAALMMGSDAASSLDLLLALARDATSFQWSGKRDGVRRFRQPTVQEAEHRLVAFRPPIREHCEQDVVAVPDHPTPSYRVAKIEGVLVRPLDDKWLVMNPHACQPLILDAQANAVLQVLDGLSTVRDIAQVAAELHGEDIEIVEGKLADLLEILALNAIVTRVE